MPVAVDAWSRLERLGSPRSSPVDVWLADLDVDDRRADALGACLSPDERARADRFRFLRDRRRYIACRGLLRLLLAEATGSDPGALVFEYGPFGKPTLRRVTGRSVQFNVSHSGGYALVALARAGEVGVDLEYVRHLDDLDRLADVVFSERERCELAGLAPRDREGAFFNGWTRKEAYLKARGDGLQRALDSFDVTLAPGEPARLLRVAGQPKEPERWVFSSFEPVAGYTAAVCAEQSACVNERRMHGADHGP